MPIYLQIVSVDDFSPTTVLHNKIVLFLCSGLTLNIQQYFYSLCLSNLIIGDSQYVCIGIISSYVEYGQKDIGGIEGDGILASVDDCQMVSPHPRYLRPGQFRIGRHAHREDLVVTGKSQLVVCLIYYHKNCDMIKKEDIKVPPIEIYTGRTNL